MSTRSAPAEARGAANRRREDLLAMVCHELRTPLASVRYSLQSLNLPMREEEQQNQLLGSIERQVVHMARLVDDLLDISRLRGEWLRLHRERFDLRATVERAIEMLAADLRAREHRLTTCMPDAPVWLHGDPQRLEQVFVNLLANADKYTAQGGQLAIHMEVRDRQAIVRIRDSGVGIAREHLPHIFDLFRQVDADDPRSRSGLGIGLAIVRGIVELHGGQVDAESKGPGQGSEFIVRLPWAA